MVCDESDDFETIACQADGTWAEPTLTCPEAVTTCGAPPDPVTNDYNGNNDNGAEVIYTCPSGHAITSTCVAPDWSHTESDITGECDANPSSCFVQIPYVEHSYIASLDGSEDGDQADITCDDG